jgi:hypothetical protein
MRDDQQNDDGPNSQQEIEDSESKENVGCSAPAGCRGALFGRNSDGHVKMAPFEMASQLRNMFTRPGNPSENPKVTSLVTRRNYYRVPTAACRA